MACPYNQEFHISNNQEITRAREGGDIHNLLRKVAYHLYQMRPENSDWDNWFSAQKLLLYWTENSPCPITLPHGLNEYLSSQEKKGKLNRKAALEKTADEIIELASTRHH